MQMRHQDPGTETAAVLIMKSLGSANLLEISKRGNFSDVFQRSLGGVHSTSAAWYIVDIEKDPRELGLLQFYVVLDSLPSCVFRYSFLSTPQIYTFFLTLTLIGCLYSIYDVLW